MSARPAVGGRSVTFRGVIAGVLKRTALMLPRVRRLRDEMRQLHDSLDGLRSASAQLQERLDEATAAAQAAVQQRADLELRVYVLRTDLNRAVIRSEELRGALRHCERSLEELRAERDALAQQGAPPTTRPNETLDGHGV
jgi:chromosome segregation ATPase